MEIYNFLVPSRLLLLLYIEKKLQLNELKIYFNFRRILRYINAERLDAAPSFLAEKHKIDRPFNRVEYEK